MMYRIAFQGVHIAKLVKYMDADPHTYKNVNQTVPNSGVDEEDWYDVLGDESENIAGLLNQYNMLREWEAEDRHFVRRPVIQFVSPFPWMDLSPAEISIHAGLTPPSE